VDFYQTTLGISSSNPYHSQSRAEQWKEWEKDFSDYCPAEKVCIFLAIRYCEKCTGKSNAGKEKQKRVNCKN